MTQRDIASQAIDNLTTAQTMNIDSRRLLKAIMCEFGGEDGFAKELRQEYLLAQEGSAARGRLLVDIMKMIHSIGPDDQDAEELSVEELSAMAILLMKKAAKHDEAEAEHAA